MGEIKGPLESALDAGFGSEWNKQHSITAGAVDTAVQPPITALELRVSTLEAEVAALTGMIPSLQASIASLSGQVSSLSEDFANRPVPRDSSPPPISTPAPTGSDAGTPSIPINTPHF